MAKAGGGGGCLVKQVGERMDDGVGALGIRNRRVAGVREHVEVGARRIENGVEWGTELVTCLCLRAR